MTPIIAALLSGYSVPGMVLSAFFTLFHYISFTSLGGRFYSQVENEGQGYLIAFPDPQGLYETASINRTPV